MVLFAKEYLPISVICFLSLISENDQPVAFSFPSPFPTVRFKKCAEACYRPKLSHDFSVRIFRNGTTDQQRI
jgi:hypothetical protein